MSQGTNTSSMAQKSGSGNQPRDCASSMYSESTTYSYAKEPAESTPNSKRGFRQKIKEAFKDVGYPPTYRYDMENGKKPADLGGPFSTNQRGPRS